MNGLRVACRSYCTFQLIEYSASQTLSLSYKIWSNSSVSCSIGSMGLIAFRKHFAALRNGSSSHFSCRVTWHIFGSSLYKRTETLKMCPVRLPSTAETSRSRPVADCSRTSFINTTKGEVHSWLCLTVSPNSFTCCLRQLDFAASPYCILLEEDALKTVLMVLLRYRGSCPAEWHPCNRRCVAPVSVLFSCAVCW